MPGGLAVATLTACAAFAAVSGSSIATVISIGNLAITEMKRAGYEMHIAAGVVGAAGTLGILIPPSVPLVIYGVLTGESIGYLLGRRYGTQPPSGYYRELARDPEAFRFASDVDADQRAEIARMRSLLAARGSPNGGP